MGVIVLTSNYLVQFPINYYGLEKILTYGAFSYPVAFLITDLANRSYGKLVAQKIVYTALEIITSKTEENPVLVLEKAVKNVTPQVEVKARRVGGSTYQVPIEIRAYRGTNISLRWINESATARSGKSMAFKLANELIDASKESGNAIKKREQTHRMAEANKAFAHFRY